MREPEAYFLTWTTYGTHLPGHAAGSTEHARIDTAAQRLPASRALRARAGRLQTEEAFVMNAHARAVVDAAIREHAAFKNWQVLALEVRSNHVHLLIRSPGTPPETVLTSCKAWATRALRSAGLLAGRDRVWTRHGSTRWINTRASLDAAFHYITAGHEADRAAARYASRPDTQAATGRERTERTQPASDHPDS